MLDFDDSTIARFNAKVDRSGGPGACWPWTGTPTKTGYGQFKHEGRTYRAHRLAWILANGPIPPDVCVCHHCDNRPCCNPACLFPGDHADNVADKVAKGRQTKGRQHGRYTRPKATARGDKNGARLHPDRVPRGEANGMSHLSTEDVQSIRKRYADGSANMPALAREYSLSVTSVWRIVHRMVWAHI